MNSGQPDAFETTLQKTNAWLKQLGELLGWEDRQRAYQALRAVLHVFRDRLPVMEAAHLGAQLPMLVRGFYYEGWRPAAVPLKIKNPQEFYDLVQEHFTTDRNENPQRLTEAALAVLEANLAPGELEKLRGTLPAELQGALWPKPGQVASP